MPGPPHLNTMILVVVAVLRVIEPPSPATDPVAGTLAVVFQAILLMPGIVDLRMERIPAILAISCFHGISSLWRNFMPDGKE